jgi:type III secretory pathway component EscV
LDTLQSQTTARNDLRDHTSSSKKTQHEKTEKTHPVAANVGSTKQRHCNHESGEDQIEQQQQTFLATDNKTEIVKIRVQCRDERETTIEHSK